MPDLRDLIDDADVPDRERARLERVHALLVQAGPPPELPPDLAAAPAFDADARATNVVPFLPRRRRGLSLGIAAAVGVIAFSLGALWGQEQEDFDATRTVTMHGLRDVAPARASLEIGDEDAGNWPMLVRVNGLPPLPKSQYYELFLTRKGRPIATCATFNTKSGDQTKFRITVAYRLKRFDGWVVTRVRNVRGDHTKDVVMTTAT